MLQFSVGIEIFSSTSALRDMVHHFTQQTSHLVLKILSCMTQGHRRRCSFMHVLLSLHSECGHHTSWVMTIMQLQMPTPTYLLYAKADKGFVGTIHWNLFLSGVAPACISMHWSLSPSQMKSQILLLALIGHQWAKAWKILAGGFNSPILQQLLLFTLCEHAQAQKAAQIRCPLSPLDALYTDCAVE